MSVHVLAAVLSESQSEGLTRLVAVILADAAGADGIVWLEQNRISERARITERQVRREIRRLEQLGEIETRQAQRGRRRVNVYRLAMGAEVPQYERLPFAIDDPFADDRTDSPLVATTGHTGPDDRTDEVTTTGHLRARDQKDERKENVIEREATPEARPRDEIWDELEKHFGAVAPKTNAHAKRNKAVADLKRAGATPETIAAALRAWPRTFSVTATDVALATHYPQLVHRRSGLEPKPVDEILDLPDVSEDDRAANLERLRALSSGVGEAA